MAWWKSKIIKLYTMKILDYEIAPLVDCWWVWMQPKKHLNPTLSFNCFSANSNCCWSCWYFCVALPLKNHVLAGHVVAGTRRALAHDFSIFSIPPQNESISSLLEKEFPHPNFGIEVFKKWYWSSTNFKEKSFQSAIKIQKNGEKKNIHHSKSQPNPLLSAKDQPVVHESEAMDPSRFPRCSSGLLKAATRYGAGGFTSPIRTNGGNLWISFLVGESLLVCDLHTVS